MTQAVDKQVCKHQRRFAEATATAADELTEAALKAAVHVIQSETGVSSAQRVRAQLKTEAIARRILDGSGRLVSSVLRSALPDPWLPEAFEAAVFSVGKLFCTAYMARANR